MITDGLCPLVASLLYELLCVILTIVCDGAKSCVEEQAISRQPVAYIIRQISEACLCTSSVFSMQFHVQLPSRQIDICRKGSYETPAIGVT